MFPRCAIEPGVHHRRDWISISGVGPWRWACTAMHCAKRVTAAVRAVEEPAPLLFPLAPRSLAARFVAPGPNPAPPPSSLSSSGCLLWPRFAYLPETRRRYSSHVLDPRRHDDLQFQTNPPPSRPSPPGLSVSSSASFLALDRCWAPDFPAREFPDFQIAPRLFGLSLFGA